MSWQQELDELIQTTMAFARDARRDHATPSTPSHVSATEQAILDTLKEIVEPRTVFSPMAWPVSERDAIQQRVANFKTHQQRMTREREDYYLQMRATILTSLAKQT
jgi:hypothetical protein